MLEEAKKRDHRKAGQGAGSVYVYRGRPWFPILPSKGHDLKEYPDRLLERDPFKRELSGGFHSCDLKPQAVGDLGHWDHYKDNMYTTVIDEEDYAIKPMNCPGGMLVYKSQPRSYRDLPLRVANWVWFTVTRRAVSFTA